MSFSAENKDYYLNTDFDITSEKVQSICVFCWGLLGDVFVRVPIIEALKKKFPESSITVVVDSYSKKVIDSHPDINEIVIYNRNKKPLFKYIVESIKACILLRNKNFDLSVNLYSGGTSALVTRIINARLRLSFSHTEKLRKANNILVAHPSLCQHATKVLAGLLVPLGIKPEAVVSGTRYHCLRENQLKAEKLLKKREVKYIGVNLGASTFDKVWPVKNVVDLLVSVSKEYKIIPVVFENPGQEFLAHEFHTLYKEHGEVIILTGYRFPQEAAVLERCDLLITGDTGLMHLGVGVGVPIFSFFLVTRPEPVVPDDYPMHVCMIEDKDGIDDFGWGECGWSMLCNEIPVEYAINEFNIFVQKTLKWSL